MVSKLKIAVVGHGFVGQAVEYGFDTQDTEIILIDPNNGTSVEDLKGKAVDVAFVCVPTPMSDSGRIDDSIVLDVVTKLITYTDAIIALKSTVTPDIVDDLAELAPNRFVYNPEFLTEANAKDDFVNAEFHVFGGRDKPVDELIAMYTEYSKCYMYVYTCTAAEASFVKYAINTFLATKVTFFNQLKDCADSFGVDYNAIADAVTCDRRIGNSHMQVPGPDGKRGFGGACFPKDGNAFSYFAKGKVSLLDQALTINKNYRKVYELDEREKVMNVNFGDNE